MMEEIWIVVRCTQVDVYAVSRHMSWCGLRTGLRGDWVNRLGWEVMAVRTTCKWSLGGMQGSGRWAWDGSSSIGVHEVGWSVVTVWDVMVVGRGHNVEEEVTWFQPSGWGPSMNANRGDGEYTDSLDRDWQYTDPSR